MSQEDTIHLLKECDAGVKMGVSSIDDVLDKVESSALKEKLQESKKQHEELGNRCHSYLNVLDSEEKDPGPMAKAMAHIKTSMKLMPTPTDMEIAELMYDGCNMGIKSLYKYLHQYKGANGDSKKLTEKIIKCEEDLRETVKEYI